MIQKLRGIAHHKICLVSLTTILACAGECWAQTQSQQPPLTVMIGKNIRDAGAKGDGQTDDWSAWQTTVEHGNVFCPPGVYVIGKTIAVPSNRHIWGGRDCTLKTKDHTNVPVFTLSDVRDVFIEGISIDGSKATQIDNGLGFGVLCEGCSKTKITRLRIANTPVESIIVGKNERSGVIPEDVLIISNDSIDSSRRATFRQHYAVTSGRRILISQNSGISTDGHSAYLVDVEPNNSGNPIEDVTVVGNRGVGVSAIAVANTKENGRIVKRINITGNDVKGAGAGAGSCIRIGYADYVSVAANTVEGCGTSGMTVSGSNKVIIAGNVVTDFGTAGSPDGATGVAIDSQSESIIIEGNVFHAGRVSIGIRQAQGAAITVGPNDYIGDEMTPVAGFGFRAPVQSSSVSKHLSASGTLDFADWRGDVCEEKSIRLPGAVVGSTVLLTLPKVLTANPQLAFTAFVSTPDAVTVKACKLTSGLIIDSPPVVIRADVWVDND